MDLRLLIGISHIRPVGNKVILPPKELVTQDGTFLATQDGKDIVTQQS